MTGWEDAPALPPLAASEVHVWLARVDAEPDAERAWLGLLSHEERERAARLAIPARRTAFVRGRSLLRLLVARYSGGSAGSVTLGTRAHGKPFVSDPAPARALEVSLSGSGALVAVAVGRGAEVGVDVEQLRAADLERVAARFFAPEEVEQLDALPADEWPPAFFRCWTRKEAVVKATGAGLSCPLRDFAVTIAPGEAALLRLDPRWGAARDWSLFDLAPGEGYAGALAVRTGGAGLRRLVWRDD